MKIYTDASVKNNIGAWAAHIITQSFDVTIGNSFELKNRSVNYAEMYAIYKALLYVSKMNVTVPITIYTDSMCALRWITKYPPKPYSPNQDIYQLVMAQLEKYEYTVVHTKAHQNDRYNNTCDKYAKQFRETHV